MIKVITAGRSNAESYFSHGGIREHEELKHNPVLVFCVGEITLDADAHGTCLLVPTITVKIVKRPADLLTEEYYKDEWECMAQWPGKHRSDFFHFTVGDFRSYIQDKPLKEGQIL